MSSNETISAAQLNANRQNAQASTGPRSDESKQRTRLNGLRHGLSGQTVVMPYEDQKEYEDFCTEVVASLNPADDTERSLAQTIANESWRFDRARAIEENVFALGRATADPTNKVDVALNQAITYLDHAKEIQLLSLYAGRISRSIQKTKNELLALQDQRRVAREVALEEEILLAQLAKSKEEIYKTQENGFGFSASEVLRILDRRNRLKEARTLFPTAQNPNKARPFPRKSDPTVTRAA